KRNPNFTKILINRNSWDKYNIIIFGWVLTCIIILNILSVKLKMDGVVKAETMDKLENCLSSNVVDSSTVEVYPYKKIIIATVFTVIIVGGIALSIYFYMQSGSSRPVSIEDECAIALEQNRELFE